MVNAPVKKEREKKNICICICILRISKFFLLNQIMKIYVEKMMDGGSVVWPVDWPVAWPVDWPVNISPIYLEFKFS